jgi:hypothetical protein
MMIINLTEEEALTIADFLVNSIEAIKTRPKTPEVGQFLDASHEFIVQTWMKTNEQDKQMIIEEHQKKLKDEN